MSSSVAATPFLVTKEYRRFAEFCDACRRYRYIGLCFGPPGVGKTVSARRYARWDIVESSNPWWMPSSSAEAPSPDLEEGMRFDTILYTPRVSNSPSQIEREVEEARKHVHMLSWYQDWYRCRKERGAGERGRTDGEDTSPSPAVGEPATLVLIDEADRLKTAGLEQARDLFDRDGIGLVLIGMPGLEKRLSRYAQLYSRVGFVHAFRPLGEAEMRHLLKEKWRQMGLTLTEGDFTDEEATAAILRITGGNFRLLHRLLSQVERILLLNELRTVTREVIEAAREGLVIGNV
jgi:DNA transposition AAA+ family ATPase